MGSFSLAGGSYWVYSVSLVFSVVVQSLAFAIKDSEMAINENGQHNDFHT